MDLQLLPLDLAVLFEDLFKLIIAFALAFPIAWDRERSTHIMGLRTFPLVAVASCSYVLIAIGVVGPSTDAQARIIQGLMSGIGFLGGGAILKGEDQVRGTATAATVWATGAIGAAVAYSRYEMAIVVALASFLTLYLLTPMKTRFNSRSGDIAERSGS